MPYLQRRTIRRLVLTIVTVIAIGVRGERPSASAPDVVLYASDVSVVTGNWTRVPFADAAGGAALVSSDLGWSQTDSPLAAPVHYVEATFNAEAGVSYHVWLRLKASGNSKFNDSVWVQFSGALDHSRTPVYAIGSTSALLVNLEPCNACGVANWGWQDKAYWLSQASTVQFAASGSQRIRIQLREDGVALDQIVLSAGPYLVTPPGSVTNDTTIVSKTASSSPAPTSAPAPAPTPATGPEPFGGTRIQLPGTIGAELFDLGGEGTAFHDTTRGNSGGAFRSTDVDLEASSEGGYDVGWTAPGEWLNYSVNVSASGTCVARLRVASPSGATMHVGFNGPSNVWAEVRIPPTGGWQNWTTVDVPVAVNAGAQLMTVLFDTGGMNLQKVTLTSSVSTPMPAPSPSPAPSEGGPFGSTSVTLPGIVEAENFDTGVDGVSYHDTTAGNSGGAYRATGVDLEAASDGGYNVGWTAAGEWLNYTVNVPVAGAYTAAIKVASPNGGAMHIGFNGASSVWTSVTVPATGGWQRWTAVPVPVTLGAGVQQLTVLFDTGGLNLDSIAVGASSSGPPAPTGTVLPVITWNIQVNDSSEAHARLAMGLLAQTAPRPEIIVVEETYRQHFNVYLDELQRQTGRTWRGVFASHCAPGAWNGGACSSAWSEGVSIFTMHEIVDSGSILMPYADCWSSARTAVRAAVKVGSTVVQVFGTHLQSNSCGDMSGPRAQSMAQLEAWASTFIGPKIAAGDFNGDPAEVNTTAGMLPTFVDTWTAGTGNHLTAYGPTPTRKIDYWFVDSTGRIVPEAGEVVYSTGATSDHYPVHATLLVK